MTLDIQTEDYNLFEAWYLKHFFVKRHEDLYSDPEVIAACYASWQAARLDLTNTPHP